MMMQLNQTGKWFIWAFIVLLGASFIAMDLAGLKQDGAPPIAVVNGKEISAEYFDRQLESYMAQTENLDDAQKTMVRRKLLDEMVQRELIKGYINQMGLFASGAEMLNDLTNNPPEGVKQSPAFMTDSIFDIKKYHAWLKDGKTYDIPEMKQYEAMLREEKVPMLQLQTFVAAGFRTTDLEAEFAIAQRETKVKLDIAFAPADSFKVSPSSISEAEIKAYYEAHPDSFWIQNDIARFVSVSAPIVASAQDDSIARSVAQDILNQLNAPDAPKFEEAAQMNSEDKGSAEKGGSLGGMQAMSNWDTTFANAVRTLDSGKISGLVKTPFGYHIIKSNGKKIEEGVEKADVQHILVQVNPGTETVDATKNAIAEARKLVAEDNKSLTEVQTALKAKLNIQIDTSAWLQRSESIQKLGYMRGLSSFGFSKAKATGTVSEPLENSQFVAFVVKAGYEKGGKRSIERFRPQIQSLVAQEKKLALAKAQLEKSLATIQSGAAVSGISIDTTTLISVDGFVPKLGFGNILMPKITKQALNTWGSVLLSDNGAVSVKVKEKTLPDAATLSQLTKQEVATSSRYLAPIVFKDWIQNMKSGKGVVDNLDLLYVE
jgi:peptidyl-prolyl cis-trans isomerase D